MKPFFVIFLLLLMGSIDSFPGIIGEDINVNHTRPKTPIKIYNRHKRPKDNSTIDREIDAYLLEGFIYITFESAEGMATVIQIENGMTTLSRHYASTLSEIKVPLAESSSPIQLIIKTSDGNEYEGWIMPDD